MNNDPLKAPYSDPAYRIELLEIRIKELEKANEELREGLLWDLNEYI
ncbi:hypothetical protein LCGC14_1170570 [marine sediment metagenome]|uniref:Uncharacterized protein n=1 Tax=marine sediment metagenome TaxID=412755 RepID=A0A0F9P850_9ZZZZ